ncbi:MAG: hypothetical protein QG671_1771 [Actinomycetota bacterium]|nr:hypothetical protein [Actinomycetota bacterium]
MSRHQPLHSPPDGGHEFENIHWRRRKGVALNVTPKPWAVGLVSNRFVDQSVR